MRLLTLRDIMKRFNVGAFLRMGWVAGFTGGGVTAVHSIPGVSAKATHEPLPDEFQKAGQTFRELGTHCVELGLHASAASCNRLVALADRKDALFSDLESLLQELYGRLDDEMKARWFFCVDADKTSYFLPSPFGADVATKFSEAMTDIEEAAKCLAMDRGTACVFHLMRVLECALRSLAISLNDPDLDPRRNPSWDAILRKCRAQLALPLAQRSPEWRADDQFFSAVTERLMAVKDAWRNPTMHVEKKYTPEEAEDIWNSTRAFMRQVATKLGGS